jgi:hypothetical protein
MPLNDPVQVVMAQEKASAPSAGAQKKQLTANRIIWFLARSCECAAASNAKVIITGDKGLLSLNRYRKINILTPEEFLKTRRG